MQYLDLTHQGSMKIIICFGGVFNEKNKALICGFLALLLVVIVPFSVFAAELDKKEDSIDSLDYQITCDGGGKHRMEARGIGRVFSGSYSNPGSEVLYGYTKQCAYCNRVLISEYNPTYDNMIGKYRLDYVTDTIGYSTYFYGGLHGSFYGNISQDS